VQIEFVKPGKLKPAPYNPRRIDEDNLRRLTALLDAHGFVDPIIARREDGLVIGGHQRLKANALRAEPDGVVPVIYLDGIDDANAKALNIALNNPHAMGEYDDVKLAELLVEIDCGELDLQAVTGFAEAEIAELITRLDEHLPKGDEDDVPDVQETPVSKTGDLWVLGEHRLLCGDSTEAGDVAGLMAGKKAKIVFTDPPYGVDVQERDLQQAEVRGRRKDGKGVANDNLSGDALRQFLDDAFAAALDVSVPGACWHVCAPPSVGYRHPLNALAEIGVARHGLVWVKDRFVMGRCDYHYRHENIIYGGAPGGPHRPVPTRDQDSVWEVARPGKSPEHPTMKPLELLAKAFGNSSEPGDVAYEPFSGSGTTIIACEQLGRKARAIEIEPLYVDVGVRRWQNYTGQDAVLDGDGRTFAEVTAERVGSTG